MKVPDRAVIAEKVSAVELKPASKARVELRRLGVSGYRLKGAQVVSGVKVINPPLCGPLAVVPRAIRLLLGGRITRSLEGRTEEFLLARVLVDAAQESGSEEVRVVSLAPK
jgi:hypothetical protein